MLLTVQEATRWTTTQFEAAVINLSVHEARGDSRLADYRKITTLQLIGGIHCDTS